MSKILFFSLSLVFIMSSCSKENNGLSENINLDDQLSIRDASQWCDGGSQDVPESWIVNFNSPDEDVCCVTFRLPVTNTVVRFHVTNFDFGVDEGSRIFVDYRLVIDGNGIGTVCFDQIGTHFAMEIPGVGCFVHEHLC